MTLFPESFFVLVIATAILLTGVGGITLVALLIRDWKEGSLW